jgi:hypothetical protein
MEKFMTEFIDPSAIPTASATVPISDLPRAIDDETAPWPHGPIHPDPVMAEVQRNWLTVELFQKSPPSPPSP